MRWKRGSPEADEKRQKDKEAEARRGKVYIGDTRVAVGRYRWASACERAPRLILHRALSLAPADSTRIAARALGDEGERAGRSERCLRARDNRRREPAAAPGAIEALPRGRRLAGSDDARARRARQVAASRCRFYNYSGPFCKLTPAALPIFPRHGRSPSEGRGSRLCHFNVNAALATLDALA